MKLSAVLVAAVLAGAVLAPTPGAYADDKPTIVMGEIVRYEPGHVIVLRDSSNNEVSYMLTPSVTIPSGVAVGRRVTLYTTHASDGGWNVTRVSTSVTPEGNLQRTVERTKTTPSGETTRTSTTTIEGTVQAYEPGHSITVVRPDGSKYTYVVNERTQIPEGLAIGRTVMLRPITVVSDNGERVAETITYTETKTQVKHGRTTTKTKTKTKKVS